MFWRMFRKVDFVFLFLLIALIVSSFFYIKVLNNTVDKLNNEVISLKKDNEKLNIDLKNCSQINSELVKQIKIQDDEYNKKVSKLLKKINQQKIQEITIDTSIQTECERMKDLVNKYEKLDGGE